MALKLAFVLFSVTLGLAGVIQTVEHMTAATEVIEAARAGDFASF
jgi:hypothetical protein